MPRLIIRTQGEEVAALFEGQPLLSAVLSEAGLPLPQPCGGNGRCGKCAVEVSGLVSPPSTVELKSGKRLSCQTRLLGDNVVILPESRHLTQIQLDGSRRIELKDPLPGRFGAAIDLGTTTLALRIFDLKTGEMLAAATAGNPQSAVAADVMGRIGYALQNGPDRLQRLVQDALRQCLRQACAQANLTMTDIESMVVAGNTTMLYLLTGRSPKSLAYAPFLADSLFGEWTTILGIKTYLPHCMNAFVGADISCAVLASGMTELHSPAVLVDVGTNGEIALWKDGALSVASTAAGPAFEGAGIVMGSASVPGAIDKVWVQDGQLMARTINNQTPQGICGSGLIDAVAAMLETGDVDETGALDDDSVIVSGEVWLYQKDIRAVQLAKAAIAAGLETLLNHAKTTPDTVQNFYLAGGFGNHLDMDSAARIGLIPAPLAKKAQAIGNASLDGASMLLLNQTNINKIAALANESQHVALGGNPAFNDAFMEHMLFPE